MALTDTAHNLRYTNTGGFAKLRNLKIDSNIMLTVITDQQNHLITAQTRNVRHFIYAQRSVRNVYVKFSNERIALKAMRSSYSSRQNSWPPIEKCGTEISIKKGLPSPYIKRRIV